VHDLRLIIEHSRVISADSAGERPLEAADLVQRGIATRVARFLPTLQVEKTTSSSAVDSLTSMQIPRTEVGSQGEAQVLAAWCAEHHFRSIVFVTTRSITPPVTRWSNSMRMMAPPRSGLARLVDRRTDFDKLRDRLEDRAKRMKSTA
jgi:hypothetical protein